ncbi:hypothetical protein V8B97DRAFT_947966 [Scleroderma yunnanense]
MSLTSSEAIFASEHDLLAYAQIAATTAALYDHALTFGREVDLIWRSPPSLAMVLYIIDRYLGDAVLLLFQFRTWGTVIFSWATQAIMQLRIYAMYRRSKRILALLLTFFAAEVTAISVVVWRAIGPSSGLQVTLLDSQSPKGQYCLFSGLSGSFTFLFIPVFCFETLLFALAAKVYYEKTRSTNELRASGGQMEVSSFTKILARDSLYYFFGNLVTCAVVMGLWESIPVSFSNRITDNFVSYSSQARDANICVPLVMLLEVIIGTRLVINFRDRFSRPERGTVVSGRYSTFTRDGVQMDNPRITISYEIETVVEGEKSEEANKY